jgi:hypothetical protein
MDCPGRTRWQDSFLLRSVLSLPVLREVTNVLGFASVFDGKARVENSEPGKLDRELTAAVPSSRSVSSPQRCEPPSPCAAKYWGAAQMAGAWLGYVLTSAATNASAIASAEQIPCHA